MNKNKLTIRNIGPLKDVVIDIAKYNVFIGPQSSGKSCILKIASFCKWVEKRIELSQSPDKYLNDDVFWKRLVDFHKLNGFINDNFLIKYESQHMEFSMYGSPSDIKYVFKWDTEEKWAYLRPKIAYIPAERNIVAVIPNWFDISFNNKNNTLNYLSDWENARSFFSQKNHLEILDLGMSYYYDKENRRESVRVDNEKELLFSNVSSGLQSVIPLCGIIEYLTLYARAQERRHGVEMKNELENLENLLYQEKFPYLGGGKFVLRPEQQSSESSELRAKPFDDYETAKEFDWTLNNYAKTQYTSLYLEEPEENLFPSTQYALIKWMAERINLVDDNQIWIATHSPYILSSFNNLIQAAESDNQAAETIIGKKSTVPFENINVYSVSNGTVKEIKDNELRLISQNDLDAVSDIISSDFSNLISL